MPPANAAPAASDWPSGMTLPMRFVETGTSRTFIIPDLGNEGGGPAFEALRALRDRREALLASAMGADAAPKRAPPTCTAADVAALSVAHLSRAACEKHLNDLAATAWKGFLRSEYQALVAGGLPGAAVDAIAQRHSKLKASGLPRYVYHKSKKPVQFEVKYPLQGVGHADREVCAALTADARREGEANGAATCARWRVCCTESRGTAELRFTTTLADGTTDQEREAVAVRAVADIKAALSTVLPPPPAAAAPAAAGTTEARPRGGSDSGHAAHAGAGGGAGAGAGAGASAPRGRAASYEGAAVAHVKRDRSPEAAATAIARRKQAGGRRPRSTSTGAATNSTAPPSTRGAGAGAGGGAGAGAGAGAGGAGAAARGADDALSSYIESLHELPPGDLEAAVATAQLRLQLLCPAACQAPLLPWEAAASAAGWEAIPEHQPTHAALADAAFGALEPPPGTERAKPDLLFGDDLVSVWDTQ